MSIKSKMKAVWTKVKAWVYGALIALGLMVPALSQVTSFTYTPANSRVDGTPMPLSEIAETRLYCDGSLVASELGADSSIDADLSVGSHTCYATHVDTAGQESVPSNEVVRVVKPSLPNPPVLN